MYWEEELDARIVDYRHKYGNYMSAPYEMEPLADSTIQHTEWLLESLHKAVEIRDLNIRCENDGDITFSVSTSSRRLQCNVHKNMVYYQLYYDLEIDNEPEWHFTRIDDNTLEFFIRFLENQ